MTSTPDKNGSHTPASNGIEHESADLFLLNDESHTLLYMKTLQFATLKHSTQRRKDPEKTPYINHPIGVAHILAFEGGIRDIRVLQTALLHDTVEDTETTFDELEEQFGLEIRDFVDEVTDDKSLSYYERKDHQILRAPIISPQAKLVKMADKIYNLRDLLRVTPPGWSAERLQEYFVWAGKVAEGLLGTNDKLEEILREVLAQKQVHLRHHARAPSIPLSPP